MNDKGNPQIQVMDLISQLEGKVRDKNEKIEELEKHYATCISKFIDIGTKLGLKPGNNTYYINDIETVIEELKEESHRWRTKFILQVMLGWKNPIPLGVGLLWGGIITWMLVK